MNIQDDLFSFDISEVDGFDLDDLQILSVADALALPETGASSVIGSCGACSCCGSSSCFSISGGS